MNQALHVYIRGPFGAPTSRVFQVVTVFVFSSQLGSSVYSPIQKQIQHSVFRQIQIQTACSVCSQIQSVCNLRPGAACSLDRDRDRSYSLRLNSPVDHAQVTRSPSGTGRSLSLWPLYQSLNLVADAELLILIDQYFLQILGGEEHLSEVLLQMDKRPLQPGAAVLSTSRDICISPLPPIW